MIKPKMDKTDHDLLIELNTKFEIFINQYGKDMKNLNDGITRQLATHDLQIGQHEKRLDELERIVGVVKPEETLKDYQEFKEDVKTLILTVTTKANVYRMIAGAIGALVMFVLTQLPTMLEAWGLIK